MEVPGIRRVRSTTFRGATEISAQFEPRTDIILALQQVQNHVAELRSDLPPDIELTVERLTPAEFPMLSYNLTGGLSEADLHDYAFFVMRPALARVPGVGRVDVQASDTREIEVVVDPARMLASGVRRSCETASSRALLSASLRRAISALVASLRRRSRRRPSASWSAASERRRVASASNATVVAGLIAHSDP